MTTVTLLQTQAIINNDIAKVRALLNKDKTIEDNVDFTDFCHPLCDCDRCEELKRQQREETQDDDDDETDSATVYSRGEQGRTGLHHAARKGKSLLPEGQCNISI